MKIVFPLILLLISIPGFGLSEELSCFDIHSDRAYRVKPGQGDLSVEFSDMVTQETFSATRDIFGFGPDRPLYLSTEQLDQDGREMMAEACRLNPQPSKFVVNVMLWSGKRDGATAIADRCFTCM